MTTGAQPLAYLDGGQADAARRAVHQQDLAPGQPGLILQPQMRGAIGDRKAGGGDIVDGIGQYEYALLRCDHLFGKAAVLEHRHHPVAGAAARHRRPALEHPAGDFEAGRERQFRLRLVAAGDDQRIGEVQAGGAHGDAHSVGREWRIRRILDAKPAGIAPFPANDRTHWPLLSPFSLFCLG